MKHITIIRRKALGAGSARGLLAYCNGVNTQDVSVILYEGEHLSCIRNDKLHTEKAKQILAKTDLILRWGCTSEVGVGNDKTLNNSKGIHTVTNKLSFRKLLQDVWGTDVVPKSIFSGVKYPADFFDPEQDLVVRPKNHAQGKNLFVCQHQHLANTLNQYKNVLSDGWYASELIMKKAEYRVYVADGEVLTVAEKTPDDPNQVAWNVAQGGEFTVVKWGDWPINALNVAVRAANHTGLDYTGIDVMVDYNGKAYVIEANSAPSLPLLSDKSVSYRQKCVGKWLRWMMEEPDAIELIAEPDEILTWKDYIHPAIIKFKEVQE